MSVIIESELSYEYVRIYAWAPRSNQSKQDPSDTRHYRIKIQAGQCQVGREAAALKMTRGNISGIYHVYNGNIWLC